MYTGMATSPEVVGWKINVKENCCENALKKMVWMGACHPSKQYY
jgi:hypothetical protein